VLQSSAELEEAAVILNGRAATTPGSKSEKNQ